MRTGSPPPGGQASIEPAAVRELADPGHLDARLVAAGDEALEQRALPDALADPDARPRGPQLLGAERALDEAPGANR